MSLRGLKIFLAEPETTPPSSDVLRRGGIGNCLACDPAPSFTDFGFHNTGAAQAEYDSVHGLGAFMARSVPDLAARQGNFDAFLPPTALHPNALGPFLDTPIKDKPGRTDLGLRNVFANPDLPRPQDRSRALCAPPSRLVLRPTCCRGPSRCSKLPGCEHRLKSTW